MASILGPAIQMADGHIEISCDVIPNNETIHSTPTKSIAETAQLCAQAFILSITSTRLSLPCFTNLEQQLERYKIWTGYLGVFAAGKGSADHRLRHDLATSEIIISMLNRLAVRLRAFGDHQGIQEEESKPISVMATTSDASSSGSSSCLVLSSENDSDSVDASDSNTKDDRNPKLVEIDEIISRLYRISSIIRRPAPNSESQRVVKFIQDEASDLDLSDLDGHVRWQLQQRCPRLLEGSSLHDRLVKGVLYRRKRILYHASHERKLQHGTEHAFSPKAPPKAQDTAKNGTALDEQELNQQRIPLHARQATKAVTFIETTASTAKKTPLSTYGKSVVLTGVTMSQAGRRQHLDIPPIPQPFFPGTKDIKCPYCSHLITEELGKDDKLRSTRWR